jgi:hypothetical protein
MSMTLPPSLLHKYPTTVFVETGTCIGEGIQVALDAGYEDIRSIEVLEGRVERTRKRFEGYPGVKIYHGSSSGFVFANMIADITVPATFWLDAHTDTQPDLQDDSAPLLDELMIISEHPVKNHVILIDDMRLCGHGNWRDTTRIKVIGAIIRINPLYDIEYVDSVLKWTNDILVAHVPVEE